jgi:hypothetical protein
MISIAILHQHFARRIPIIAHWLFDVEASMVLKAIPKERIPRKYGYIAPPHMALKTHLLDLII